MERCGGRRSFEKPPVEVPPARLQVIGFNISPGMKAAEAAAAARAVQGSLDMVSSPTASYNYELTPPSLPCKPASSPRSALQQLLLHQSLPSTSPTSSNNSMPPSLLPPSLHTFTLAAGLQLTSPKPPATSSPILSSIQNSASGLATSTAPPAPTNPKWPSGGLQLPFSTSPASAANQTWTSGAISRPPSPHYELKGRLISAKQVIIPHPAKSKKSSWLHDDDDDDDGDDDDDDDDDHPPSAAEKCEKNSWKGVQQIIEQSLGNDKGRKNTRTEEKSKKSSLFMFVASSPATDFYHHHHPSEQYDSSKDMDFLSSCHLCRRLLGHGQDVFMYSGDKAFCSMECRYQQIVIDERKERCPPPIIRSGASPVFHHTSVTATTTHHPIMINNPHFINTAAAA